MKCRNCILAVVGLLLTGYQLFAQGTYSGSVNYTTIGVSQDKRVFAYEGGNQVLASGSAYQTALYWAPAGTAVEADFVQVGNAVGFLTGANAGTFFGNVRLITGLPQDGAVVALQSRGWAVGPGVTSYETAVLNGAATGKGPIFDMKTAYYPDPTPNIGADAGWRGYVIAVPEPSTIFLGAFAAGLLFLGRKLRKGK